MDKSETIILSDEENFQNEKSIYLIIIIILLGFCIYFIFFSDSKNIQVQSQLKNLYLNQLILRNKFNPIINPNYNKISFDNDSVIILENFLNPEYFLYLKDQFKDKNFESKDFYQRKGSGIGFHSLANLTDLNGFVELYLSYEITEELSKILGKSINRPPLSDNNACSILAYTKPGDFIDWHIDDSTLHGDRYVVLISLINNNKESECCSENEFMYKIKEEVNKIKLKPNCLMIFKGDEIPHKSTAIGDLEKRILLSMTFCDICQFKKNIFYDVYENIKNYILYEK